MANVGDFHWELFLSLVLCTLFSFASGWEEKEWGEKKDRGWKRMLSGQSTALAAFLYVLFFSLSWLIGKILWGEWWGKVGDLLFGGGYLMAFFFIIRIGGSLFVFPAWSGLGVIPLVVLLFPLSSYGRVEILLGVILIMLGCMAQLFHVEPP